MAVAVGCLMLSGCIYTVNYTTEPAGAILTYQDGDPIGMTPVSRDYREDSRYMDDEGCMLVYGVTATWASGARASTGRTIRLCKGIGDYRVHLVRPADAPGLETDIRVATMLTDAAARRKKEAEDELAESLDDLVQTMLI
ncbi:MAG: hypothetical protein F4089_10965, partial [Gammaproteobacteria bacterium]|nr:hypothetical protein [Gammaproteobacteria bacterium]